jgi:hypothetical protein
MQREWQRLLVVRRTLGYDPKRVLSFLVLRGTSFGTKPVNVPELTGNRPARFFPGTHVSSLNSLINFNCIMFLTKKDSIKCHSKIVFSVTVRLYVLPVFHIRRLHGL